MSTMDKALAAIAKGETLTTAAVRAYLNTAPADTDRGPATTPRRERLVSLG